MAFLNVRAEREKKAHPDNAGAGKNMMTNPEDMKKVLAAMAGGGEK